MVFAITKRAARGHAKAIRTGRPGWDLMPLVSGVGKTPTTPSPDGRFTPELVLLRIITGELTLSKYEARMFVLAAIQSAAPERIPRYTRYVMKLVPPSTRHPLETLMKAMWKDPFLDGLVDEGALQKARQLTLKLLGERFGVTDDVRERIETCADAATVDTWFTRAITATSLDEVFEES